MNRYITRAYLVIGLDIQQVPPKFISIGLFSEDNPTVMLSRVRTFVALRGSGHTYSQGIRHIARQLTDPLNAWMVASLSDHDRKRIFDKGLETGL